jgi:hypothetical protein
MSYQNQTAAEIKWNIDNERFKKANQVAEEINADQTKHSLRKTMQIKKTSQINPLRWCLTPSTDYMGYQMQFLKCPKYIELTDPVHIRKSKFSYHVKDISDHNYNLLNVTLQEVGLKPDGKLSQLRELYLRSDDGLKFRDFRGHEIPSMDLPNYSRAFIKIYIQGRKERDDKNYPIWKLLEIHCF